ncbi:Arc-like DNA binding domain-containing protein [Rosenbergiella nectarea]|uniref:Arc-like DNA binding domain-containing protein n=1 Tax=Rosenbergiella nectarea TaxID=988801 RepID=A0A1H9EQZ6_9GAMM|nr:Arc family DNA-binding protein [Rosenbergiella nectarea]SEQ27623.1 Arc-like DNA binding domain-containing protein [Rosenbergiella nectarea]
MKVRDIAPYGVRMPAELKDKLQEIAKRNGRSLNSEIVKILEEYVTPPKIEDLKAPTAEQLQSFEEMQKWTSDVAEKIKQMDRAFRKNFPDYGEGE